MSQASGKGATWVGWAISALLIAGSVVLWTQRQYVVDAIQYHQYTPTEAIKQITQEAGLTDDAIFTFYATNPAVEPSDSFNAHCERKEADSPILGCYAASRIYIFDVTDDRLDGIKVVTAAHELLHAEYDRLPESERKRLTGLLNAEYTPGTDEKLDARMKYYEKTEPGETVNELHSIVGTEFGSISPELESYYRRYFTDRKALVRLHVEVESRFNTLSKEADAIVARIESLATSINSSTDQYNADVAALDAAVQEFNRRASRSGGFTTQKEFQAARQELVDRSAALSVSRQAIQADIAEYKTLLARLDAINTESASLNKSLDSALQEVPSV